MGTPLFRFGERSGVKDVRTTCAPPSLCGDSIRNICSLGRLAYLIMAAGIGVFFWPNVIHHTNEFAIARGIQFALLAGLGLIAALGLRYPLQMLPILLF